jgi:hypothetical protein
VGLERDRFEGGGIPGGPVSNDHPRIVADRLPGYCLINDDRLIDRGSSHNGDRPIKTCHPTRGCRLTGACPLYLPPLAAPFS